MYVVTSSLLVISCGNIEYC